MQRRADTAGEKGWTQVGSQGRRLNVLLANDHLGWGNQTHGVARLFELWAKHLPPERFKVTVCILREQRALGERLVQQGIDLRFLGKGKLDPTTFFALRRLVRELEIDVLHLQAYGTANFGRVLGRLAGIPTLVHFHDTTPNYPWYQGVADRLLREWADVYVAISQSVRACWAARLGLDPRRMLVMRNAIDAAAFEAPDPREVAWQRASLGLPPGAPVIGTVTRLFEEKGTRYLLEAVPRVLAAEPDARFVIVGDGPLRPELERRAAELGVGGRVAFTGYRADVGSVLALFDVFVLTSCFTEGGCPLPVLEALAMAKPVIVTDVVDVVTHDVDGRVIAPRDAALLSDEILALLHAPERAQQLGLAGQRLVRGWDVRQYVQQLGQIYEALAEGSGRRRAGD